MSRTTGKRPAKRTTEHTPEHTGEHPPKDGKEPKPPEKPKADASTRQPTNAKRSKKATLANTGAIFYFSNAAVKRECADDLKRIKEECDPNKGEDTGKASKAAKADDRHLHLGTLADKVKQGVHTMDEAGKKMSLYKDNEKTNSWVGAHCHGQWFKPTTESNGFDNFREQLGKLQGDLKQQAIDLAKKAGAKVVDKVATAAKDYAVRTAEKEGLAAVTLVVPGAGEVIEAGTQIWVAADGVISTVGTAWNVAKFAWKEGPKLIEDIKALYGQVDQISKWLKPEGIQDLWATSMAAAALGNPCLKARKCKLVPYKKTASPESQAKSGEGCCPGQTGHHVLPDAMFHDAVPNAKGTGTKKGDVRKCWSGYKHGDAPTICLEGTTNNAANGSHGLAHAATEAIVDKHRNSPDMDYTEARDKISQALAEPYGCSPKCIAAQLDQYYKDAHSKSCGNLKKAKVTPHSGNPGGGPKITEGPNGI